MSHRPAMIASVVRSCIAPVVRESPPACGVVTISKVEVSGDLSIATVWVSALQRPEEAVAFLESRRKDIARRMSSIGTYKTPVLRFVIDHSSEEGERIDRLLR